MKASMIVDLKYKTNDVLHKKRREKDLKNHPFFGMLKADKGTVDDVTNKLRISRYNNI